MNEFESLMHALTTARFLTTEWKPLHYAYMHPENGGWYCIGRKELIPPKTPYFEMVYGGGVNFGITE